MLISLQINSPKQAASLSSKPECRGQQTFNDEFALCCCSWQQTVRSLGTEGERDGRGRGEEEGVGGKREMRGVGGVGEGGGRDRVDRQTVAAGNHRQPGADH